jgi:hypothetical protein
MNKVLEIIKEKLKGLSPVGKKMFIEDLLDFIKNY